MAIKPSCFTKDFMTAEMYHLTMLASAKNASILVAQMQSSAACVAESSTQEKGYLSALRSAHDDYITTLTAIARV